MSGATWFSMVGAVAALVCAVAEMVFVARGSRLEIATTAASVAAFLVLVSMGLMLRRTAARGAKAGERGSADSG